MSGRDLFDLYRQLLVIVVGTYAVVGTVNFVLRWQAASGAARRTEALVRRYLVVQLLRLRLGRFALDGIQIAALLGILGYVLWLH